MEADLYQIETSNTAIYPKDRAMEYLIMGLLSEAGEIAGKYKKVIRDKNGDFDLSDKIAMAHELGDVLWYIAQIGIEINTNMSELMDINIEKLSARKEKGTIGGSGDTR